VQFSWPCASIRGCWRAPECSVKATSAQKTIVAWKVSKYKFAKLHQVLEAQCYVETSLTAVLLKCLKPVLKHLSDVSNRKYVNVQKTGKECKGCIYIYIYIFFFFFLHLFIYLFLFLFSASIYLLRLTMFAILAKMSATICSRTPRPASSCSAGFK
jgi:hypothetical protein